MDIWTAENIILLGFLLEGVCCRDFSVSLPQKIEALSGSCVIINCTFEIQQQYDQYLTESAAAGLWLKDGDNVNDRQVFNSRDTKPNHFNGEITGKLHEKNCTTVFYNVSSKHNDAPKISPSSSCSRTNVTACFCEADGNPSPELEWHLSGRPVTNSSNTFISEERLSSTGLRSSITLHQSLTHTSTLLCVSRNTHGTASQLLQPPVSHLQFVDCQQATVSLLIILTLLLVLYALTVGLGLYKIRQLSTKLKAQNEAVDTYASLQLSAPPSEYETLNIKRERMFMLIQEVLV